MLAIRCFFYDPFSLNLRPPLSLTLFFQVHPELPRYVPSTSTTQPHAPFTFSFSFSRAHVRVQWVRAALAGSPKQGFVCLFFLITAVFVKGFILVYDVTKKTSFEGLEAIKSMIWKVKVRNEPPPIPTPRVPRPM